MKPRLIFFLLAAGLLASSSVFAQKKKKKGEPEKPAKMELKTENDRVSYALGVNLAENVSRSGLDSINAEALAQAIKDYFAKDSMLLDPAASGQLLNDFFMNIQKKKAEAAVAKGQQFLAENSKKPGVVTLPSGLQYEVLTPGKGTVKPTPNSRVTTHYTGFLISGKVFDSSVQRGQPATFPVNGVIKGWTEALQLMTEGAKWKLYIPSNLAYGERGAGADIGPNETLIFEVELIKIEE